jgi:hypothetical protein
LSHSQGTSILALANSRTAPLGPDVLSTCCDKSRFAAWRKSPSSYLVCEDDQAIPVQAQDGIITREKVLGAKIETERLLVSHSTYIVKPECVSIFLRRAAGENLPEEKLKKESMEKWERRLQFLNVGYDGASNARNFDKE